MVQLRDKILKEGDYEDTIDGKPKKIVLNELNETIDLGLEQFYSLRVG